MLVRSAARMLALATGLIFLAPALAAPALPAGTLYDEAFQWTDDAGQRVELASFRGRPVVLTMFYSSCTQTCASTLGKLRAIETALKERKRDAEFVLVSYDSIFDTPGALAGYREKKGLDGSHWHLLSGSPASVKRFANRIGLGNYLDAGDHIAHSFRILLLDENGVAQRALDPLHARVASLFEPLEAAKTRGQHEPEPQPGGESCH